jgi:hypothetical protein
MIAIGKKKPGMGSERPSSPSLASDEEDSGMELESMAKAFFEAGSKGKYGKAASIFKEMSKACSGEGYEEED